MPIEELLKVHIITLNFIENQKNIIYKSILLITVFTDIRSLN